MTHRWRNRAVRALAAVAATLFLIWLTLSPADPDLFPGDGPTVHVVDHGYHSGIVLRQADLRAASIEIGRSDAAAAARLRWLATRFPDAEWIELGWGDAAFYQVTPTIGDVDVLLGLRAILWPTDSVLQVVPIRAEPEVAFARSEQISLALSPAGFLLLATELAATIPEQPTDPMGPSLYGNGAFYPAALDYHLFRTCNHWISGLLRAAGVPSSPLPGTFSASMMFELQWRVAQGVHTSQD